MSATDLTGLLEAIRDHLDVPRAAPGHYDAQVRLRYDRALSLLGVLDSILDNGSHPDTMVEALRRSAESLHVYYPIARDEAADHLADCLVCGPGCCSPFLGIHGSCPGPHVGAEAVEVR